MLKLAVALRRCTPHTFLSRSATNVPVRWWPTLENPWAESTKSPTEVADTNITKVDYEISTDDFKWVEKCISSSRIPLPPPDAKYPTPSGWVPPNPELSKNLPYSVRRSSNHMLPVYYSEHNRKQREQAHGKRQLTVIRNIDGDMWALAEELRIVLEQKCPGKLFMCQVDEATRKIRIEGIFLQEVADFLLAKGF